MGINFDGYPELEVSIPVGSVEMGKTGDCRDRYKVRTDEIAESIRIIEQCLERLQRELKRSPDFDPRAKLPKKIIPKEQDFYV